MSDTTVLIVGAGPTGLAMAVSLAQYGIDCRIVEKHSEPTKTSNALAVHSRTLEVFADLGIIDAALNHGRKLKAMNVYANDKLLVHAETSALPSQYNFILSLPQSTTEAILTEKLTEFNITVERGKTLTDFKQAEQKVTATITAENNNTETIDANYLIACDGGHSHIREQLGIEFVGKQLSQHFIMADCDIESDLAKDEVFAFLTAQGAMALIPVGKENFRLICEVSTDEQLKAEKNPAQSDFERLIKERLNNRIKISNPSWMSAFWISAKHIAKYRDNRIFFAGDAAHIHSPVGGQGMNTGIQDAHNLAWKIAAVCKHDFKTDILDSYQIERLPVAKHVLATSTESTKAISTKNPFLQKIRNIAVKILGKFETIQHKIVLEMSELDIHYDDNNWLDEDLREASNNFRNGIMLGERAANPQMNGEYLYEQLAKHQYNCLLFPDANTDLTSLATEISQAFNGIVNAVLIDSELDYEKYARKAYHVDRNCLLLLRPDNYVGFRSVPASFKALEQYFTNLRLSK